MELMQKKLSQSGYARRMSQVNIKKSPMGIISICVISFLFNAHSLLADGLFHFPEPHRSDVNMSVLIQDIVGIDLVSGSELGIFNTEGLLGGALLIDLTEGPPWGTAVWQDDGVTDELDGMLPGDSLLFIFWDLVSNREYALNPEIEQGNTVFSPNGFLVLTLSYFDVPVSPHWIRIPGDFSVTEGDLIEFIIEGGDLNEDSLDLSLGANNLPPSASFVVNDSEQGIFRWQTSVTDSGVYNVNFILSDGMFSIDSTVTISVANLSPDRGFNLIEGIFPNPCNSETRLVYVIPERGFVTLESFDVLGRRLFSEGIGIRDEGEYAADINMELYSPGTYLFKLYVDRIQDTTMCIVLR